MVIAIKIKFLCMFRSECMIGVLKQIWELFDLVCRIVLILFMLWSFWHGVKIESGGLVIELYGIGRFFK